MICAKCGTEYEGSQCPKCDGPVIKVNNSDYLARRKAYEERQARLRAREKEDSEAENSADASDESQTDDKNSYSGKSSDIDKNRNNKKKNNNSSNKKNNNKNNKKNNDNNNINDADINKNEKKHTRKPKNYDEGVFDITKVDFNQVADKIKTGRDKLASSTDKFIKESGKKQNNKNKNTQYKNVQNKNSQKNNTQNKDAGNAPDISIRKNDKKRIPYTKAGIISAAILILVAVIVVTVNVVNRRNTRIYMSDGNKIYDVSSIDSKYVCDNQDAVFAPDDVTFYTPEWPQDIDRNSVIAKTTSPKGTYYAADTYNSDSGMYTLYIWSEETCVKVTENTYAHDVYYITDKGTVIYEETETINDNGKTGARLLSMAELKKDKTSESGYVCDVNTIERNLKSASVYSDKSVIIVLNDDGRLYQYDYSRKVSTEVDIYVDSVSTLSGTTNMYSTGAGHLNTSSSADSYIYSISGSDYYVDVKNARQTLLKGVTGTNNTYIYDKSNGYLYWISNRKLSCARFKDDEVSDITVMENTGTSVNVVYIPDSEEIVYVNDAMQLVKASKGKKTFVTEAVMDGSLSLVNNTDKSLTYISDGRQYYLKDISAKPVSVCETDELTATSNTSVYKNRIYYYGADGQLYSCSLKGEGNNLIGNVDRFFVGEKHS